MPGKELVAAYRLHAAHCVEISKIVNDPMQKMTLLHMAQTWLRLAEQAEQTSNVENIVAEQPGSPSAK